MIFWCIIKPTRRAAITIPRGRFLQDTPYPQLKAVPLLWSYLFFQTLRWWDLCYGITVLYQFFGGCEITSPACHNRRSKTSAENSFLQQSKRKPKSDVSKKYICNSLAHLNREKMIDWQHTNSSRIKLLISYWFLHPPLRQVANCILPIVLPIPPLANNGRGEDYGDWCTWQQK